jgi:phosphatidylglycerol---prolipoprotein diacylglyceryl transferase
MRPVLFEIFGATIHSYTVMLYVGLVAGIITAYRVAPLVGLNPARVWTASMILAVPALAGARLLFVAVNWEVYARAPQRIWRCAEGGASLYGGLLLALVVSVPLLPALNLAFWSFWDVAIMAMLIGMVFTRVGCFLNGCCGGRPTSSMIGITSADPQGITRRRIPAQLLESLLALVLLGLVYLTLPRRPFAGAVFLGVVTVYSIARIGLELTRETVDVVHGLKSNIVIAIGLIIVATIAALTLSGR